eukprot:12272898-Alexandrium_andersonii.AAC.1
MCLCVRARFGEEVLRQRWPLSESRRRGGASSNGPRARESSFHARHVLDFWVHRAIAPAFHAPTARPGGGHGAIVAAAAAAA